MQLMKEDFAYHGNYFGNENFFGYNRNLPDFQKSYGYIENLFWSKWTFPCFTGALLSYHFVVIKITNFLYALPFC